MDDRLKIKARDELFIYTEKTLGSAFGNLNARQQSIAMTKFFVQQIRNPTKVGISEDDMNEAIVDGANDLGCDFIYRDDGHVLIIQSKYRKSGTSEAAADISHFMTIFTRLQNPKL